jgi:hypothetical protein
MAVEVSVYVLHANGEQARPHREMVDEGKLRAAVRKIMTGIAKDYAAPAARRPVVTIRLYPVDDAGRP